MLKTQLLKMISSSTGDEGDFPLFPSEVLEEVGRASDRDPVPLINSPSVHSSGSPVNPSLFGKSLHTPAYLDDDEAAASLPLDLELRESGVSAGCLGVWSKRRLEVGEEFGPFEGSRWRQDWEVGAKITEENVP